MTRTQAIADWLKQFGLTAYLQNELPDDVTFPYMTVSIPKGAWGDEVSATINCYFYTRSNLIPDATAEEIIREIEQQPIVFYNEGQGCVRIKPATGVVLNQTTEPADKNVRVRIINLILEDIYNMR